MISDQLEFIIAYLCCGNKKWFLIVLYLNNQNKIVTLLIYSKNYSCYQMNSHLVSRGKITFLYYEIFYKVGKLFVKISKCIFIIYFEIRWVKFILEQMDGGRL